MPNPNLMVLTDDERAALECWRKQTARSVPPETSTIDPLVDQLEGIAAAVSEIKSDLIKLNNNFDHLISRLGSLIERRASS